MLRDRQDIPDVTLVFGNEDEWRDKRILPQGWRMIYRQQKEGSIDKKCSIKEGKKISGLEEEEKNVGMDTVDRAMACEL